MLLVLQNNARLNACHWTNGQIGCMALIFETMVHKARQKCVFICHLFLSACVQQVYFRRKKMSVQSAEICRVDTLDWIAPLYVINHETFCCFIRSEQKSTTRRKKTKSKWKQCLPKASECVKCLLLYESILLGEKTKTSHSHPPLPPPKKKEEEKKGYWRHWSPFLEEIIFLLFLSLVFYT